jgi:hypothetical protein
VHFDGTTAFGYSGIGDIILRDTRNLTSKIVDITDFWQITPGSFVDNVSEKSAAYTRRVSKVSRKRRDGLNGRGS